MEYKVIFKNEFVENLTHEQIKQNLIRLFKTTPEIIEQRFFSNHEDVIVKGVSEEEADRYVNLLCGAGAWVHKELDIDFDDVVPVPTVPKHNAHRSIYGDYVSSSQTVVELKHADSILGRDGNAIDTEALEKESSQSSHNKETPVDIPSSYQADYTPDPTFRRREGRLQGGIKADPNIKVKSRNWSPNMLPIFVTTLRIGRIRFLSRLLAAIVVPQMLLWLLLLLDISPFAIFTEYLDATQLGLLMAIALFLWLTLICLFLNQRLCDLDLPSRWLLIIFLPILVAAAGLTMHKIQQVEEAHSRAAKEVVQNIALHIKNKKVETEADQQKRFIKDNTQFFSQLAVVIAIAQVISLLFFLALFILPGKKTGNQFGEPSPQIGIVSVISLTICLLFVARDWVGPRYFPERYASLEQKQYRLLMESIITKLEEDTPLPPEVKAKLYELPKEVKSMTPIGKK